MSDDRWTIGHFIVGALLVTAFLLGVGFAFGWLMKSTYATNERVDVLEQWQRCETQLREEMRRP